MYLKKTKKKDGRTYLAIVKSVHVPKSHPKTVTVKKIGYDTDFLHLYDDPIAHFQQVAREMTEDEQEGNKPILLEMRQDDKVVVGQRYDKNLGFTVLSALYHKLGIDQFLRNRQRYESFQYDANAIFKLLVYGRVLRPDSKKATYEFREWFFESPDCELIDVYRCLSYLSRFTTSLPEHLHRQVLAHYGRNTDIVYYDVTNYYFEIDEQDDWRKDGLSKENRRSPIIQMGLFTDAGGLPILYRLYAGNTSDVLTLRDITRDMRVSLNLKKLIVVADRGVISGDNIYYLKSCHYGYVMSYSILKAGQDFQDFVLDQGGYVETVIADDEDDFGTLKVKSRRCPRTIWVTVDEKTKKRQKRIVHEKQVVYYSEKYARRAKRERQKMIEKALSLIDNPSSYEKSTSYGAAKYIMNFQVDEQGEIRDDVKAHLLLDSERIKKEAQLDGYYAIVTSEMGRTDIDIIQTYRGLWQIEQNFRISKSDLETRPVYLSRDERIQAHFLLCFVSLLLAKLIQQQVKGHPSIAAIQKALVSYTARQLKDNYYVLGDVDDVLDNIARSFNMDISQRYRTLEQIRQFIGESKKQE